MPSLLQIRLDEDKNEANERRAGALHGPTRHVGYALGGSVPPAPSDRCIMIESVQRPNL